VQYSGPIAVDAGFEARARLLCRARLAARAASICSSSAGGARSSGGWSALGQPARSSMLDHAIDAATMTANETNMIATIFIPPCRTPAARRQ
jgi:hypothetical protein